jgi:predicted nuclease of predicted toxin-antitoxin system
VNRLFIDLYLDEDVSVLLADLIRARGFEVITTVEAGLRGTTDAEQLAYAVTHQKTLLTHNRVDFESLAAQYAANEQAHFGIIIAARRSPYDLAQRILTLLNHVTADEMVNQLRYV